MADDPNEDSWLYGSGNPEQKDDITDEKDAHENAVGNSNKDIKPAVNEDEVRIIYFI